MTDAVSALVPPSVAENLFALRRDLHRHPELAFEEHRTADVLEHHLSELPGVTVRRVGKTGIVARVPGRSRAAPVVAIRGDIDALPITEETGIPWASETAGVMHACGHDVHATWTVGAAHLLVADPAAGDVLLLLQPAEEVGRGALAMLDGRVLDGGVAIIGGLTLGSPVILYQIWKFISPGLYANEKKAVVPFVTQTWEIDLFYALI